MSDAAIAGIELAVGVVTAALAILLWRAGGRWPRVVSAIMAVAGAAAVLRAASTLFGG